MIVWFDSETTGLSPKRDSILEVACIVTDDAFREVARFERVLSWRRDVAEALANAQPCDIAGLSNASGVDPVVIEMHQRNGLWAEVANATYSIARVDEELAAFIQDRAVKVVDGRIDRPQLAGSSVHFDATFLAIHMPQAHARLHYRQIDVTTINEIARRAWPTVHAGRPRSTGAAHRAMPDIEQSLAVARYYVEALTAGERSTSLWTTGRTSYADNPPAGGPHTLADSHQIAAWLWSQPTLSTDDLITAILRGDWRHA